MQEPEPSFDRQPVGTFTLVCDHALSTKRKGVDRTHLHLGLIGAYCSAGAGVGGSHCRCCEAEGCLRNVWPPDKTVFYGPEPAANPISQVGSFDCDIQRILVETRSTVGVVQNLSKVINVGLSLIVEGRDAYSSPFLIIIS